MKIEAAQRLILSEADPTKAKAYLRELTGLALNKLENENGWRMDFVLPQDVNLPTIKRRVSTKLGKPIKIDKGVAWKINSYRWIEIYKSSFGDYFVISVQDRKQRM